MSIFRRAPRRTLAAELGVATDEIPHGADTGQPFRLFAAWDDDTLTTVWRAVYWAASGSMPTGTPSESELDVVLGLLHAAEEVTP